MGQVESNVVDLQSFRARKAQVEGGQSKIGQTFLPATSSSDPVPLAQSGRREVDLNERIDRIKSSIQRINQLMAELRTMSESERKN